jgi:type IV secretory pathway TraG/TraD family ATPase VirD4
MKLFHLLIQVIGFLLSGLGNLLQAIIELFEKKSGFNAEFGSESSIASPWNKGFLIAKHRRLTRRKSYENILIAGPTGSGKTTRLLLKNLYALKNCSIIVNDPSKELYHLASGYLSQFFTIKTLNFSDSSLSSGYNILSRISRPNDINKIADLLVRTTISGNSSDPFWSLQTKALLAVLIRLVLYQEREYQNMANVLYILNQFAVNPETVDKWIVRTGDEKLLLEYKAIITTPEKTLQNIVASAKAALQLFDDPEIARVTSHDSISFDSFREKPTVLFLHNSIADQKYISILNSIFFEQLYGYILKKLPEKEELDLFIILEEASSLHVPVLPVAIANTRKHRVGNIICCQGTNQLHTFYKDEASNIVSNCITKIYLPGQTAMDTLREIETISGKCIHKDEKGTERVRPLITIDEIRLLEENHSLILHSNHPIIKGRTSPFYRSWKYKQYAAIPPIPFSTDIPTGAMPLLTAL